MDTTRRRLITTAAGTGWLGTFAGCLGGTPNNTGDDAGATAQASFYVFGDVASRVAGDAATAELLVPVGQHGHGWEPGPRVREAIRDADLFVHGMAGFQPWADAVLSDLGADGSGVATVDASADVDLISAGGTDREHDHEEESDDQETGTDPHFWMDPVRLKTAVSTVRRGFADVDSERADAYADNAEAFRAELDDLHGRIESTVADGARDVLLFAGHDSYRYFTDRYDVEVRTLTGVSPDDRPTPGDIQRAREVIQEHGLEYVCADPLASRRAADQVVAETDADEVLPLTAMPGLTDEWAENDWGYVEVTENVNLPTLERALGA